MEKRTFDGSGREKTRVDWAPQESTWQDKNKQDKSGHDFSQNRTEQGMKCTGQISTAQDMNEGGGYDRSGQIKTELDRTDKTGQDIMLYDTSRKDIIE